MTETKYTQHRGNLKSGKTILVSRNLDSVMSSVIT